MFADVNFCPCHRSHLHMIEGSAAEARGRAAVRRRLRARGSGGADNWLREGTTGKPAAVINTQPPRIKHLLRSSKIYFTHLTRAVRVK